MLILLTGRLYKRQTKKEIRIQIQSTFAANNGDQLHYLLHVPEGNSESGYPMLMILHGMGERGNDLSQLFVHGIPKVVQQDANFPFVTV